MEREHLKLVRMPGPAPSHDVKTEAYEYTWYQVLRRKSLDADLEREGIFMEATGA